MYISIAGNGYASACISYRDENDSSKVRVDRLYLGKVLDREKGIYQNRERGIFTFNPETQEFGKVPESYVPPQKSKKQNIPLSPYFGDGFLLSNFIHKTGIEEAIDCISYDNKDTLHAMILFYAVCKLANYDAISWYNTNIARLIYPKADITSQGISDFLAAVGTDENQQAYQKAYTRFVTDHCSRDTDILLETTGLTDSILGAAASHDGHNGQECSEFQLILVVQKATGLPLLYQILPSSIADASALEQAVADINASGTDTSSCITDTGCTSSENLDLFYDENHTCKTAFITEIDGTDKQFSAMLKENAGRIEKQENLVRQDDCIMYLTRRQIMAGKNKDKPAWLYLCLDILRQADENREILDKAAENKMPALDIHQALQSTGYSGIVSGTEYSNKEIVHAYCQRQIAGQFFDTAKNYTRLLPQGTNHDAVIKGHLLMSYIAACVIQLLRLRLKESKMHLESRLDYLHDQKCTVFKDKIVTDAPQPEADEAYKALGIPCPVSLMRKTGRLQYEMPAPDWQKRMDGERKKGKQDLASENIPDNAPKRGRGRPKGSKNKKTIEREALEAANQTQQVKRGPGRPKGSRNKKTLAEEARVAKILARAARQERSSSQGSTSRQNEDESRHDAAIAGNSVALSCVPAENTAGRASEE